jgi:hypothetical protein
LAHAHWKLSARMQQWMVKHYSDFEQEPLRLILDFKEASALPRLLFREGEGSQLPEAIRQELDQRDHFADLFYAFALRFLEEGGAIEVGDRTSSCLRIGGLKDQELLKSWIADQPFSADGKNWRLDDRGPKRQILFVQDLSQENLGSLLRFSELGISFLLVSVKAGQSADRIAAVESFDFEVLWLDGEVKTTKTDPARAQAS